MGLAEDMTNLGNNFSQSFDDRINFIGHNLFEVKKAKRNTHRFLNNLKRDRKMMSRKLHNDLHNFTNDLTDTVNTLLNRFKKNRNHLHQEFKTGHNAFCRASKTMANKRHNFFANVKRAEQRFEKRTPHP